MQSISTGYNLSNVLVLDNFLNDPARVRASALAAGVGTWRPNKGEVGSSVYDGMGFWGDHSTLLRALTAAVGRPVYPNSMFFRVTNADTEAAYVHSDREAGDFTAIVYLSQHGPESGTGFYKHRASGMTHMPSFESMRAHPALWERLKREMVEGSPKEWELMHFVQGRYNRALIFDAPRFHARSPRHGYDTTPEAGRMVWACHFYV